MRWPYFSIPIQKQEIMDDNLEKMIELAQGNERLYEIDIQKIIAWRMNPMILKELRNEDKRVKEAYVRMAEHMSSRKN